MGGGGVPKNAHFGTAAVSFILRLFEDSVVQMEDADKPANTSDQRPPWSKEEINTPQGPVLFGIYGTVDCYLVRVGGNN